MVLCPPYTLAGISYSPIFTYVQLFEDNSSPLGRIRSKLGQMILPGLPEVFEHHMTCKNSRGDGKTIS